MITFDSSTTINRPIDEVFGYLADLGKQAEWSSAVQEARVESDGPVGLGTRYIQVVKMLGRRAEGLMEVSEYEPNRCIGFRSLGGPMKLHWTVILEPAPSGTHLHADTEAEGSGAFRLAEPLLQRAMKRQADHDFQNLKDLLETPLPVTA